MQVSHIVVTCIKSSQVHTFQWSKLWWQVCCVGDTWRFAWEQPGTQWDTQVAACLGPIISHVCCTWQKRQSASSKGKAMLKQALQCLTEITRSLPASTWASAWQQVVLCLLMHALAETISARLTVMHMQQIAQTVFLHKRTVMRLAFLIYVAEP